MTQLPNCFSFVFNSCVSYDKKNVPEKKTQKIKLVLGNKSRKFITQESTSQILNSYNTTIQKQRQKYSNIDTNCTSIQYIRPQPISYYTITPFMQNQNCKHYYPDNQRKSKSLTMNKKHSSHQIKPKSQPKYEIQIQNKPTIKIIYQNPKISRFEQPKKKEILNLKSSESLVNQFRTNLQIYQSTKDSCIETAYNTENIQNQSLENSKKRSQQMIKQQINLLDKSFNQNQSLINLETIPQQESSVSIQSARANHKNKAKIHSLAFCARTIESNYDSAGRGSEKYQESVVLSRDGLYNIPLDQLLEKHRVEGFGQNYSSRIQRRNRKTTGFEQMNNNYGEYDHSPDIRLSSDGRFQKRNNSQITQLSNCQSYTENSLKSFQIPIKTIKKKPVRKIDYENIEISQNPQLSQSIRKKHILFEKKSSVVYQCFLPMINFIFAIQRVKFYENRSLESKNKIETMAIIDHPNILSIYYHLIDDDYSAILGFEYPQYTLQSQLLMKKSYTESASINILKNIANGLGKLHSMGISYGNFKCSDFYLINQVCKLGNWENFTFDRNIANDCLRLGIVAYELKYGLLPQQIRQNTEQILLKVKFQPSLSPLQTNYNILITKLLKSQIKNAMQVLCQPIFY